MIMMTKYLFYRSADRCDDNDATVLEFPTHENEMEIIHATNIHQSVTVSNKKILLAACKLFNPVLKRRSTPDEIGKLEVLQEINMRVHDWKTKFKPTAKLWFQYLDMVTCVSTTKVLNDWAIERGDN